MNHITRERAAGLAADHFGTGRYEYTPAETATALGRLGMHRAENGNFKRTSALQDAMPKSANWSRRFFTTATSKPCRNWSENFAKPEQSAMQHRSRGSHSHRCQRTHTANSAKPRQPYGESRTADCRCLENRPRQNEPILQNGQSPIHRTAEPEKANQTWHSSQTSGIRRTVQIRQKSTLQRQSDTTC